MMCNRDTTMQRWLWILAVFLFARIIQTGANGYNENSPPLVRLERTWTVQASEGVGALVTLVQAEDAEDDTLAFGLERNGLDTDTRPLPFAIDSRTGRVSVNDSLADWVNRTVRVFVTVTDGGLTVKTKVFAQIVNATGSGLGPPHHHQPPSSRATSAGLGQATTTSYPASSAGAHGTISYEYNSAPVLRLERTWTVRASEGLGALVALVQAEDAEDDPLTFELERNDLVTDARPLPFAIDSRTGRVSVNDSLADWMNRTVTLFVTVTDGRLTVKTEVIVQIVNATGSGLGPPHHHQPPSSPAVKPPPRPSPPPAQV